MMNEQADELDEPKLFVAAKNAGDGKTQT